MNNSKLLDTIAFVFLFIGFMGIVLVMQSYVWMISGPSFLPHAFKEWLNLIWGSLGLFFLAYFIYLFSLGSALFLGSPFAQKLLKWSILFNLFFMTLSFFGRALAIVRFLLNDQSYYIFTSIAGILVFCLFYAFNLYLYFHLKERQAKPSLA